jgi:hypothetical protein
LPLSGAFTENERAVFTYYFGEYAAKLGRDEYVAGVPEAIVQSVGSAILLGGYAGEEEIAALRRDPRSEPVREVCRRAAEFGAMTDELRRLVRMRTFQVRLRLRRQQRKIEREILDRANCSSAALASYPRHARAAIEDRVIVGGLKRAGFEPLRQRHESLGHCLKVLSGSIGSVFNDHIFRGTIDGEHVGDRLATVLLDLEVTVDPTLTLDPAWQTFPLKWVCHDLELPRVRSLVRAHHRGESMEAYFVDRYADGAEKVLDQYAALTAIPILSSRREAIREAFGAYDSGKHRASLCTSLPIIEGMLRDLCRAIEHKHGQKSVTNGHPWMKIRDVLRSTAVRKELDEDFLTYFCEELYPARNPTLHGQRPDVGPREEAAAKLATVEYLIRRLGSWMTIEVLALFEDVLPGTMRGLIQTFESAKAELRIQQEAR